MIYRVRMSYIDDSSDWVENIDVPDCENPESYVRQLVEDFNRVESARYGAYRQS